MFKMQPIIKDLDIQGFNSIYYFEFSKNFCHAPEKHDFWEMVYVDGGSINAITNGIGCTLNQGQAIFHEPMEMHAHISDNRVANNLLVVCFTVEGDMMHTLRNKTFTLDKTSRTLLSLFLEEAKNAIGQIPGDYQDKNSLRFLPDAFGASQLLSCYFTELLIHLIRNEGALGKAMLPGKISRGIANNSLAELIVEYLKANVYSNISLEKLCKHFLLGKTQLCKIFRENTAMSPMDYYASLKIKEAKKLLREKNNSVSQISDILGYSSVHTFSRSFKKSVGLSPTSYQKSIL